MTHDARRGRVKLPVRPRSVPFDVDLGPGPAGGVTAVYSRCSAEPPDAADSNPRTQLPTYAIGRGCDLYRYDFGTRGERKITAHSLARASEFLPSVWRGGLAFARVYEHRRGVEGERAHVYHGSLGSRRAPRRLRGGTPGHWEDVNYSGKGPPDYVGGDRPMGLDLAGTRIAFVWNLDRGESCEPDEPPDELIVHLRSEIWAQRVDGADRELIEYGCTGDETEHFFSPSFSGDQIFYYRRLNVESAGGRFRAYDFDRKTFSESRAGRRALSIARDGGTTYFSLLPRTGRIRIVRGTDLVFEPSQRSANR